MLLEVVLADEAFELFAQLALAKDHEPNVRQPLHDDVRGFDEVALVPGGITLNPDEVDISFRLGELSLHLPFWASAMDGVVDVAFAVAMGRLGGIAVLNLDGLQTRYEDPAPIIRRIAR